MTTSASSWHGATLCSARDATIYPQLLRHIFVSERESCDSAAGPDNAGAALIMGNSESQWKRRYDLSHTRRET